MNGASRPAARRFSGIRARLSLVVLLAIVPLAAHMVYDAYHARAAQLAGGRATLRSLAALVGGDMEMRIADTQMLLRALAEAPDIRSARQPACASLLAGVVSEAPRYDHMFVARRDGGHVCSEVPASGPVNSAEREYFRRVLQSRAPVAGKPVIAHLTGRAVLPVARPILDRAGEVDKVLVAAIAVDWLAERFTRADTFAGAALMIWDENRTVLYRYPDNDQYFGRTHAGAPLLSDPGVKNGAGVEAVGADGRIRVFAVAGLKNHPELGLTIAVGAPVDEMTAGANRKLIRDLALLGILALLGVVGARVTGDVLVRRPVGALGEASRLLAAGDAGARVGGPYAGGELGALARDFDRMAEDMERRQAAILAGAEELKRVNRMLKVLSECNQALVRANSEPELLDGICSQIVRYGGYRMAWVGLIGTDAQCRIEPVASAGDEAGYLDAVRISWADDEFGRGPAGEAVRNGAVQVTTDIATDPLFVRWREAALARGYRAAAALPLRSGSETLGVLGLFAAEPEAFDAAETHLLQELAEDIAFGMHALRARAARDRAERALRTNEAQLRQLSQRLFETEENERRRLARELHDRIGQNVTALSLNLNLVRGELPEDARHKVNTRLHDCESLLYQTAQLVRNVLVDLRPPGLDELGLLAALKEHARGVAERGEFAVAVTGSEIHPRLAPAAEIALFRIVQEALNNISKHARATEVSVTLESDPASAILTVADNGRGFDTAARPAQPTASLGMVSMRERAESIGARLRVESTPGRGTRVIVEAPRAPSGREDAPGIEPVQDLGVWGSLKDIRKDET